MKERFHPITTLFSNISCLSLTIWVGYHLLNIATFWLTGSSFPEKLGNRYIENCTLIVTGISAFFLLICHIVEYHLSLREARQKDTAQPGNNKS